MVNVHFISEESFYFFFYKRMFVLLLLQRDITFEILLEFKKIKTKLSFFIAGTVIFTIQIDKIF